MKNLSFISLVFFAVALLATPGFSEQAFETPAEAKSKSVSFEEAQARYEEVINQSWKQPAVWTEDQRRSACNHFQYNKAWDGCFPVSTRRPECLIMVHNRESNFPPLISKDNPILSSYQMEQKGCGAICSDEEMEQEENTTNASMAWQAPCLFHEKLCYEKKSEKYLGMYNCGDWPDCRFEPDGLSEVDRYKCFPAK